MKYLSKNEEEKQVSDEFCVFFFASYLHIFNSALFFSHGDVRTGNKQTKNKLQTLFLFGHRRKFDTDYVNAIGGWMGCVWYYGMVYGMVWYGTAWGG